MKLYIHPVFCTVYLLRENGVRLSPDEIKARGGVAGFLVFGQRPVVPEMIANLHPKQGDVQQLLPQLECAEVVKVRDGLMVRGLLVNWKDYSSVRQSWWCVPSIGPA